MLLRDILFADCEALHFVLRNIDAPVFAVVLFDILQELDQLQAEHVGTAGPKPIILEGPLTEIIDGDTVTLKRKRY